MINNIMLKYLFGLVEERKLNIELDNIASCGFEKKNELYVLKCFQGMDTNVNVNDFQDYTGFECFINSVNIDDYVEDDYLAHGVTFVKRVFNKWNIQFPQLDLRAILINDEFGLKVKFHVHRSNERWLADDLDGYEEGVMFIDSN